MTGRSVTTPLIAALTLGLAPLVPEPHVLEKLRWVLAGGAGMRPIDVFDLALHGAPWVWLAAVVLTSRRAAPPAGDAAAP